MAATGTRAPRRPGGARGRSGPATVAGVVLLVAGLVCLGWVGYQYVGTDLLAHRAFDSESRALRTQWQAGSPADPASDPAAPPPTVDPTSGRPTERPDDGVPGEAIALLRVPRFGAAYEVPVVAGTDTADLAHGVGHYDGTAAPGAVGNFAVAGHRITHGQPFARLLTLEKGDEVVVETGTAVFTYVLDSAPRDLTVPDTAGWVLDPVPGEPTVEPSRALITLTTCQDLFHSPDRSVAFGHLASTRPRSG